MKNVSKKNMSKKGMPGKAILGRGPLEEIGEPQGLKDEGMEEMKMPNKHAQAVNPPRNVRHSSTQMLKPEIQAELDAAEKVESGPQGPVGPSKLVLPNPNQTLKGSFKNKK